MLLQSLFLLILASVSPLTSAPYWGMSSSIQTFQVILISSAYSGSTSYAPSYSSYFDRSYLSTDIPRVVIGINYHNWYYYYHAYIISASATQTYLSISAQFPYTTYTFYMMAMLYTADKYPIIQHTTASVAVATIGSVASDYAVYNTLVAYPSAVNISNNILIVPFIVAIYQFSYCYGISTTARIYNQTYFEAGLSFRNSCGLYSSTNSYFLIIDRTKLQQTKIQYVDHYSLNLVEGITLSTKWTTSYNKAQSATYIQTMCNQTMIGMNQMWGSPSVTTLIWYYLCNSTVAYTTYITTLNITVTGFRKRLCDPGTKFYNDLDNLCYDSCPVRYYANSIHNFCAACPYYCYTCTDNGLNCLTCNTATDFRVFINTTVVNYTRVGTCQCMIGYYDSKLNSSICLACHYTCLTCTNVSTTCTQCQGYRKLLTNYTCPCIAGFQDLTSTPNCTEKCGDGVKFILACDDGNVVSGDGCSSTCVIEANYTCNEKTKSSPSFCGYNQQIVFTVSSIIVNNASFDINVNVGVTPVLPWMNTFNFSTLVKNNSDVNITSSTYSSGVITFNLKYSDNSDGNIVAFTFLTPTNISTTQYLLSSNFSISIPALIVPIIPPQIPAYLATSVSLLIAMSIVNIIVYILGGLKLAYVQTLWTLQISYFCLLGSFVIQPFQQTFKVINIAANGYNRVVWNEINYNSASVELTKLNYNDQFVANFNVMLIIQMIILLVSVIFYGLAKITKWNKARGVLLSVHSFLLYDTTLSFSMFNVVNSSFAMGLQIIIFLQQGLTSLSYVNIIGIALSFSITLTTLCLFIFRGNQFTNNVGMFKHDKMSRYHPIMMLTVRFSMGFVMGILYRHWYSGLTVLGIQIAYGIYISVRNPYTLSFLLRAILNQGTILQNLLVGFLYQVYRINQNDKGGLVPLWIQLFLLVVSCLTSLFYMIYTVYVKIKNMRNRNRINIQDDNGVQISTKKHKRRVSLDYNFNNTIQHFDVDNNMEISDIAKSGGGGKNVSKMKGEDY